VIVFLLMATGSGFFLWHADDMSLGMRWLCTAGLTAGLCLVGCLLE
jgi:hypothetical protein